MHGVSNKLPDDVIVILISSDFEAIPVIYCVSRMRNEGLRVALVSLEAGFTRSWHGVCIKPDYHLSQIMPNTPRLVILPGGNNCVSDLANSSQVHELIEHANNNGGRIAVLQAAEPITKMNGLLKPIAPSRLLEQGKRELSHFVTDLIDITS